MLTQVVGVILLATGIVPAEMATIVADRLERLDKLVVEVSAQPFTCPGIAPLTDRSRWRPVLATQFFKLALMPGLGLILFKLLGVAPGEFLAGLILLAAPTATVSYVMGREMGGDPDLAVAAVSASTLFSSLTYALWLALAGA